MAIHLITGLPGNAKTLFGLQTVIEMSTAAQRPVFYSGLKEFIPDDPRLNGIPWTEIDPTQWMDCPSGSLIYIDEAQKTFRNRSLGAIPPLHVTELEEHRHRGIDFVMNTQHPSLVDPAIRKLTQTHRHMVRMWGMEVSTIHKWEGQVRDNCDKPSARKDSEKTKWGFNKKLYGLYKSADVHTMKRHIPMRVKLLFLVPVLLAAAGYIVYTKTVGKHKPVEASQTALAGRQGVPGSLPGQSVVVSSAAPQSVPLAVSDPVADAKQYLLLRQPRIVGLPETAPRYDALTVPVRVPVPSMCVQVGSVREHPENVTCKCYSQQGTPMDVERNMCIGFARNGVFRDFDPEGDRRQTERMAQGAKVMEGTSSAPPSEQQPNVLSFKDIPPPARITGTSLKG